MMYLVNATITVRHRGKVHLYRGLTTFETCVVVPLCTCIPSPKWHFSVTETSWYPVVHPTSVTYGNDKMVVRRCDRRGRRLVSRPMM